VDVVGWKNGIVVNPAAASSVTWAFFDGVLFDTCGEIGCAIYSNGSAQIVRGLFFNNCWFASSGVTGGGAAGDGVNLNAGAGGIVDDIKFTGSRFISNKGHGLQVQSNLVTDLMVNGCTFFGNGQSTSNTYDGILLAAGTGNFNIIGNRIGGQHGVFFNKQRYAINLLTGTSNAYTISGNNCDGNTTVDNTGTIFDGGATSTFGQRFVDDNVGHAIRGVMDAMVAATGALNTTLTLLFGGAAKAPLPANSVRVKDQFRIKVWGTNTSTVAGITTLTIRIGTAGTTADAAVMTIALPISAAAGTAIPWSVDAIMSIRTIGAAATVHGTAIMVNQSVTSNATASTGISVFADQIIIPTFATFNSTVANYIEVCHVTAATTTTNTIQGGLIEWL